MLQVYGSGMVNSNTVNLNFHSIRSKTLQTNDFELTVPNLYLRWNSARAKAAYSRHVF